MPPVPSIVIHGHFYQPPREDPWLEEVAHQASAAPFHDWNERIEQECYRAVTAARLLDGEGRIRGILNTFEFLSFNIGPTLFEWLEREAPRSYAAILEADRRSRDRLGYGNALAMPYHHTILPLASRREKATEVRWGVTDFRRRFGRDPDGIWLPEAAVDHETLEVLAEADVGFTVLGPGQFLQAAAAGMPGLYRTAGGRRISLIGYDGPLSHDVAFGGLPRDAESWSARLLAAAGVGSKPDDPPSPPPRLIAIATDGETYGHHHRFAEMGLARTIEILSGRPEITLENFASFLARHPPIEEVRPVSPSSWSCVHGVERWRSDCGCRIAPERTSSQRWRRPLREAMSWLAGELHAIYQREGTAFFTDPWKVRDEYGSVVATPAAVPGFVRARLRDPSAAEEPGLTRAAELLELERDALRLFTSCAWFFDDVGGIEAQQVLRYAAHALELTGSEFPRIEAGFLERLALAASNDPSVGSGREVYLRHAAPTLPPTVRLAAAFFASPGVPPRLRHTPDRIWEATLEPGQLAVVRLTHRRTRRVRRYRVEGEEVGPNQYRFRVGPPDGPFSHALSLEELFERHRARTVAEAKRQVSESRLTREEWELLAAEGSDLRALAPLALERALAALEDGPSEPALSDAMHSARLMWMLGVPASFEAQTAFHRARARADGPTDWAPLAFLLGFSSREEAFRKRPQ